MTSPTTWFDLPFDLKANILVRIGVPDILENAQIVCTDWRTTCTNPAMWRVINMDICSLDVSIMNKLRGMCKIGVRRSKGQLVDLTITDFGNDELLLYVANRSKHLRRLKISCFFVDYDGSLIEPLKKLPLLEELKLYSIEISKKAIKVVGRYCPMLKTLALNQNDWDTVYRDHDISWAIGEYLHNLRHLELSGNSMTDIGLQVILDGCRHLESLDLSNSLYIDLKGDVVKRCSEKIKSLKVSNRVIGFNMSFSDDSDDE